MLSTNHASRLAGLVLVAVTAACSDAPTGPRGTSPLVPGPSTALGPKPANGHVVYASDIQGAFDVYVFDRASQTTKRLTTDPLPDFEPSLSADGKRVVWLKQTLNGVHVVMSNVDGTKFEQLTTDPVSAPRRPVFSPDLKRVVFSSFDIGVNQTHLFSIDLKTRVVTPLGDPTMFAANPSFSADGKRIVFDGEIGPRYVPFVMWADGTQPHDLPDACPVMLVCTRPVFSPDDRHVAYGTSADEVLVFDLLDGSVTPGATNARNPMWSPDGQQLAFYRVNAPAHQLGIYVKPAEGGTEEPWLTGLGFVFGAAWAK